MNILLVHPGGNDKIGSRMIPPLWPSIISSLTPDNHRIDFLYTAFEKITEKKIGRYDAVGISVPTAAANEAYKIGDMCRELSIPSIMGGIHAFVLPDEAKKHCDSVLLGEAEYVWPKILNDLENKCLKPFYKDKLTEPKDFPTPDLSIYDKYWFYTTNMVETVRGCPYDCEFCGATMYSGRRYRYKPLEKIVEEIKKWKRKNRVFFVNTNLAADIKKTKEIMKAIKDFNLMWWSACSVNVAEDEKLIKMMSEGGCSHLQFGFESISPKTLKAMNKTQNIKVNYKKLVKKLHDYNIDVVASFVFGWDTDDENTFKSTLDFALDADIDVPAYFPLIPFPGTRIFERLKSQNRILTHDWSKYNGAHIVYEPKNMTVEKFAEGLVYCWEESYSLKNICYKTMSRHRGLKKTIISLPVFLCIKHGIKRFKPYWRTCQT
ncbi:MAG: radical SAM protein [Thermoplasmatales archaeon]|nr:radical SAM protein [Thermoplasmatales archaeon]